jgi:hypothetical protein
MRLALLASLLALPAVGWTAERPRLQTEAPATYSKVKFELGVGPDQNAAFRKRLIDFASRYAPGGYPIGVAADLMQSQIYTIETAQRCTHADTIVADLVRAAAPPESVPKYLTLAMATKSCVEGLPTPR